MKDFSQSIKKKLNVVEAKLEYIRQGHKQLSEAFHDFATEVDDYIDYQTNKNQDFDSRLKQLESKN